jgi:uncharacterized membrane protein YhaH (DUF805 family)
VGSGGIFINYRRSTTAAAAGRLHDRLEQHFARRDLFMDVDAIEPGLDFVKILNDRVNSCRAFIAVIGTGWAEALDPAGGRRLDNPDDYVRVEIEAALKRDIRVIPVLVDGAQMPTAMELPPSLRPLVHRQAIELSHARFALDVDLLANAIKRADQENSAKTITFRESGQNAPSSLNQILFSLRGRISRATYWNGLAIYIAAVFLMSSLLGVYFFIDVLDTGASLEWSIYGNWRYRFLTLIICLPFYWPYFALLLKRLHDLGQGWQLLSILVLISFSTMIVVALGYKEYHIWLAIMMGTVAVFLGTIAGQVGPNRYGPAPLSRMSVRNGRPIFGSWTWRRFGAMAAGLLILILSVPLLVRHLS